MSRGWERALTVALIAVCAGAGAVAGYTRMAARPAAATHETSDLTVTVRGEVASPGSYRLPWGARVDDLLTVAGGVTADADLALVEVASPLTDGRTILVPSARSPEGHGRIDVNTASLRLLATLPGIGPVTAERIVLHRPFHRLDDLLRVPGIGPARLDALRTQVTL